MTAPDLLAEVYANSDEPQPSFTVDLAHLFHGWPTTGDLMILAVLEPAPPVAGPPEWVQATDRVFYTTAHPGPPSAVTFHADPPPRRWLLRGWLVAAASVAVGEGVDWHTTVTEGDVWQYR